MTGQSKGIGAVFTYESLVHAIAGACGGLVAMTTFYPLDTVRYRLQVENPESRAALSTLQLLQQLAGQEGFATLYRGLVPVLQSLCISNFVYFYSFHTLKALHGGSGGAFRDLCLGTLAGVINVLATTPFWVVNTRLKMKGLQEPHSQHGKTSDALGYAGLLDGLRYVWRREGVAGLWAGTAPSLMLVSNPALQFAMYETLKRQLMASAAAHRPPPALAFFALGAAAKAFATVATYPLQLIQTKLRHGRPDELSANAGVAEMFAYILRQYGVAGLYRGMEAKLLQTVLGAALMFAAYEKIAATVMSLLMRKRVAK